MKTANRFFYFNARSSQMDSHELKLETYGTDGQWVIIKNMSNEEKSEGETSREKKLRTHSTGG
jgi:hypothetical protein